MIRLLIILFFFISLNSYSQHLDMFELNSYKKVEKMRKKRYKQGVKKNSSVAKKIKHKRKKKFDPFFKQKTNFVNYYIKEEEVYI